MKRLILVSALFSLTAMASDDSKKYMSQCLRDPGTTFAKIKELRKLNACSSDFTLSECKEGLGLGTVGTAAGGKKVIERVKPKTCGLIAFQDVGQDVPSFWAALFQSQVSFAEAAGACGYNTLIKEKEEALKILDAEQAALKADVEKLERPGMTFKKAEKAFPEIDKLVEEKFKLMMDYERYQNAGVTPAQFNEELAKFDKKIAAQIASLPVGDQSVATAFSKAVHDGMIGSSVPGNLRGGIGIDAAKAQFAATQAPTEAARKEAQQLADRIERLQVSRGAINNAMVPEHLAAQIEYSSSYLSDARLRSMAEVRLNIHEKHPDIPIRREAKLAQEYMAVTDTAKMRATKFGANKAEKYAMKLVLKNGAKAVAGAATAGAASLASAAPAIVGKNTDELTDVATDALFMGSIACEQGAAGRRDYVEYDEHCRMKKDWNSSLSAFVDQPFSGIVHSFENDDGSKCKMVLEAYDKYVPKNLQRSCTNSGVVVRNQKTLSNYVATWDSSGALKDVKVNGQFDDYKQYRLGFDGNAISEMKFYNGDIAVKRWTASQLKTDENKERAKAVADHFATLAPTLMESQACCQGSISDSRCEGIQNLPEGSAARAGSGSGSGSSSGNGSGVR